MVKLHESYSFEVKIGTVRSKSGAKKTASFFRQARRRLTIPKRAELVAQSCGKSQHFAYGRKGRGRAAIAS